MAEILFPAIDPVLISLGPLRVRWYGLMFVVAFFAGQYILTRLARARFLPLPEVKIGDLIMWLVVGVLIGGRLGYCIFYQPEYLRSWRIVAVWEGGLSFHGGLIGACITFVLFARKNRISPWRMGDAVALAVPPGIFAVRIANFINGELYGRITDASVPWAMRFPTDPKAAELLHLEGLDNRERELQILAAYRDGTWAKVRDAVPLRHPSEIYEALGEGLLIGTIMLLIYRATRKRPLQSGVYGGLFLACYGAVRFFLEFFRQPDRQFEKVPGQPGTIVLGLSMGQLLCSAMIAAGLLIVAMRLRTPRALEAISSDEPG